MRLKLGEPGSNATRRPPIAEPDRHSYHSYMKKAKIADLKNNLSRYLEHVRGGGAVLVLDRDQPVAQILPLKETGPAGDRKARLVRLERRGLIRRGAGGLPEWLGKRRPPRLRGSVLRALRGERESGW